MTDFELKELEKRCNNTSKGDWKSYLEGGDHESGENFIMTGIKEGDDIWDKRRGTDIYLTGATSSDQKFIAHARQDIPKLILEIKRLKENNGRNS